MTNQGLIARIKHLLRLSRSADVNEASNAAAHAQRLMARHQIDLAMLGDVDADGTPTTVVSALGDDAIYNGVCVPFWIKQLAVGLADVNDCAAVMQIRGDTRSIGLVGTPLAISCVRYMFGYLQREIVRLASLHSAEHARTHGLRRPSTKWRNDFKIGATHEIVRRMKDARDDIFRGAPANALMRMDTLRRAARTWVDENVTRPPDKPPTAKVDADAYHTGRRAGKGVTLSTDLALPEGT